MSAFAHGTLTGYMNHGCRCEPCRAENARYFRERRAGQPSAKEQRATSGFTLRRVPTAHAVRARPSGELLVTCWCEDALVSVPALDVREGRTYSCGLRKCMPRQKENA